MRLTPPQLELVQSVLLRELEDHERRATDVSCSSELRHVYREAVDSAAAIRAALEVLRGGGGGEDDPYRTFVASRPSPHDVRAALDAIDELDPWHSERLGVRVRHSLERVHAWLDHYFPNLPKTRSRRGTR